MSVKSSELEFRVAMKCWKDVIQIGTKILRLLLHAVHSHTSTQSIHTEWRLSISGVHPIMMEKSALAGEGGGWGVHAHPLSAYDHHVQSCNVLSY